MDEGDEFDEGLSSDLWRFVTLEGRDSSNRLAGIVGFVLGSCCQGMLYRELPQPCALSTAAGLVAVFIVHNPPRLVLPERVKQVFLAHDHCRVGH
jgi:hypothetical protein